jgi:glucose uptake protein GlcU
MTVFMALLIAGVSMAFAVHQWWRGHHMMAIGFITFAYLIAGAAVQAAKNNQNAEATKVLRQPQPPD